MKQWHFIGLITLAVGLLLAPNCGEETTAEDDILKELAQVWDGNRYTRNSTGKITDHERLYLKLTTEMTYSWSFQHTMRRSPAPDTVLRQYDEDGLWEINATEDALIITPDDGDPATVAFSFAGDTLVIENSKEGQWRMQWTFSSRSDWW